MPFKIKTQCVVAFCKNTTTRGNMCEYHYRTRERNISDKKRERQRLYSSERWKKVRDIVLRNSPACKRCGRLAVEVDHIIPTSRGGEMFDLDNLQALCLECHRQKSYAENLQNYSKKDTSQAK